jgi:DNA-directed RNA polymerase, subunit E''''
MEKSCYKCGQVMEEGRPFCPHCSAPQIRVLITEPVAVATPLGETGFLPQAQGTLPAAQTVPVLAVPVQWSRAFKPCALAAGIATLLMFLGLTPAVATFCAGFLAVVFYRHAQPGVSIKAGQGARVGALAGLLCFGVIAFVSVLVVTIPDLGSRVQQQIAENAQKWAAAHPGDTRIQNALEVLKTPEGIVMMLIMLLILSIVLATLGGALGGRILGRRDPS